MNLRILHAYWEQNGIPLPIEEYVFHPGRKWPFDFAWVQQKLALEVEGGVFTRRAHGSITGILRDIEKYNQAAVDGWRVLRVIPDDVLTLKTCRMIRDALRLP